MRGVAERERIVPAMGDIWEACLESDQMRLLALVGLIAQQVMDDLAWALELGIMTETGHLLPHAVRVIEQKSNAGVPTLEEMQTACDLLTNGDGRMLCGALAHLAGHAVISPRWMLTRAVKLARREVGRDPMVRALREDQEITRHGGEYLDKRAARLAQYEAKCREVRGRTARLATGGDENTFIGEVRSA